MTDVVITGGSGFVGSAVTKYLPGSRSLSSDDLDLRDSGQVLEAFSNWRPSVVIHLAARVGGIRANLAYPADFLIDNLRIDSNLLSAVREFRPQHLISMLSTCMYPDELSPTQYPMSEERIEDGPPPPSNAAYAAAKRALWHGTRALADQYEVGVTAVVPANLYGPRDHFQSEHSHFLAAAITRVEAARRAQREAVGFFGTGVALRQYVYVDDLAWLIARLAVSSPLNQTINVAPEANISIADLANAVAEAAGYRGEVVFTGEGPDGQLRKDVSSALLRSLVPEYPEHETPLADGLSRTVDWYREHVASG